MENDIQKLLPGYAKRFNVSPPDLEKYNPLYINHILFYDTQIGASTT